MIEDTPTLVVLAIAGSRIGGCDRTHNVQFAVVALSVSKGPKCFNDVADPMIVTSRVNRPEHARLPPTFRVASCPRDAVVPDRSRAGYLVILAGQVGEQIRQIHFASRPLSRPHWTHTRADASMSPASLSATGFSSVMASSAQNQ